DAANEGVRYAIVHSGADPTGTQTKVQTFAAASMHDVTAISIAVTAPDGSYTPPNRVRVTVTYAYAPFLPKYIGAATMTTYAEGRMVAQLHETRPPQFATMVYAAGTSIPVYCHPHRILLACGAWPGHRLHASLGTPPNGTGCGRCRLRGRRGGCVLEGHRSNRKHRFPRARFFLDRVELRLQR